MNIFEILILYFCIGILCGISFEAIMIDTKLNDNTTNFERFTWVVFWPIYIIIFIIGMKK
jgi:uncharacterized membrane protein